MAEAFDMDKEVQFTYPEGYKEAMDVLFGDVPEDQRADALQAFVLSTFQR